MKTLAVVLIAMFAVVLPSLPARADTGATKPTDYLFDELLELESAKRGTELPGGSAPSCFVERYRRGVYILDDDGTVLVDEPAGWFEDCSVECTYHRIDDIDDGNPRWAQFTTVKPELVAASGPIWALVETESFNGLAVLIWYCVHPLFDTIMNESAPEDGTATGGELRLLAGFPGAPNFEPWYRFISVEPEIVDVTGTRDRLWAGIPIPDMDILAAPPIHRDNANYQVPNWVWIDEFEDPLIAVSMHAETAAVMVKADVVSITWDFGDGSGPITCEVDKLIPWTSDYHLVDDADLACTHAYRTALDGPVTVTADVTFEGESAIITRPGTTFPWPEPVWEPYAETRTEPATPIEFEVTPLLSLNVNERQEPTTESG